MLKLRVRRQPLSDHSYKAEASFDASLSVEHAGFCDNDQRWLELRFATNAVSLFDSAIYPNDFAELARMMVEVDPEAAIHAFGAALQTAEVERRRPAESDEEAA
jgi:hypothetical protein